MLDNVLSSDDNETLVGAEQFRREVHSVGQAPLFFHIVETTVVRPVDFVAFGQLFQDDELDLLQLAFGWDWPSQGRHSSTSLFSFLATGVLHHLAGKLHEL